MYRIILIRAFSQVFLNLSIGWFGSILILPGLSEKFLLLNLTGNFFCGILSLGLHVAIEGELQKWDRKK